MTDIARLIGVSQSCVSLVLNDTPGGRLSEATKLRVRQAAEQLGYTLPVRRNGARATEPRARDVIAYVVDEVSVSPHPVLNIDGARDAAWVHEATLQTHVTRGNAAFEAASIRAIRRDPTVAGVIYATSFTRQIELPSGLDGVPLVLLNCYTRRRAVPELLPGEVAGGRAATRHLIGLGHRRIAMLGGEPWMDAARDRLRGYRDALAAAGLAWDPALVCHGDWSAGSGHALTLELMRLDAPPTAFFCANDMQALGCMNALGQLGLAVPDDVSVIGYNDLELARHLHPPLSSCRVPSYELAHRAVEMLMAHAANGTALKPMLTKLECRLVQRASTAAPGPGLLVGRSG